MYSEEKKYGIIELIYIILLVWYLCNLCSYNDILKNKLATIGVIGSVNNQFWTYFGLGLLMIIVNIFITWLIIKAPIQLLMKIIFFIINVVLFIITIIIFNNPVFTTGCAVLGLAGCILFIIE